MNGLVIEVTRYAEAPWAPRIPGAAFDWAWRVRGPGLFAPIVGACAASRRQAEEMARRAATRARSAQAGKWYDAQKAASFKRGAKSMRANGRYQARRIDRAWKTAAANVILLIALLACGDDPYTPPAQPSIEVVAL